MTGGEAHRSAVMAQSDPIDPMGSVIETTHYHLLHYHQLPVPARPDTLSHGLRVGSFFVVSIPLHVPFTAHLGVP